MLCHHLQQLLVNDFVAKVSTRVWFHRTQLSDSRPSQLGGKIEAKGTAAITLFAFAMQPR